MPRRPWTSGVRPAMIASQLGSESEGTSASSLHRNESAAMEARHSRSASTPGVTSASYLGGVRVRARV